MEVASFDVIPAELAAIDDQTDAALVLTVFSDEHPLRGLAGLVDWRLRGAFSRWLVTGFATGERQEHVLFPTAGRLPQTVVVVAGLGRRSEHRTDRAAEAAAAATKAVGRLGHSSMTCGLFGLERLPTPLDRSVPELTQAIRATGALRRVTLAVPKEIREDVARAVPRS